MAQCFRRWWLAVREQIKAENTRLFRVDFYKNPRHKIRQGKGSKDALLICKYFT